MKKRVIALMMAFTLLFCIGVHAAETRIMPVIPNLSFNGEQAVCKVYVNDPGADIQVTMTLYRALSVIASWEGFGTSVVNMTRYANVKDGLEYRLVITGTIDGVPFTSVEVVGTC